MKVLSVQPGGTGIIVSGGQDSAVRQWVFDGNTLCETSSPLHHSHWITVSSSLSFHMHEPLKNFMKLGFTYILPAGFNTPTP